MLKIILINKIKVSRSEDKFNDVKSDRKDLSDSKQQRAKADDYLNDIDIKETELEIKNKELEELELKIRDKTPN